MDIQRYVINLPERSDRRCEMEKQLRSIGWEAEFQSAIRPESPGEFDSIGARGCFLSHLATLKRGLAAGNGHVLIMEDDLNFRTGFRSLWEKALDQIKNRDWSICYPGHKLEDQPDGLQELSALAPIACSHFMMFRRQSLNLVIEELEAMLLRPGGHPRGGPMHVDGAYATIRKHRQELKTWVFSPSLGYQRSSRSDIADLRLIDRLDILQPLIAPLRKLKNKIRAV